MRRVLAIDPGTTNTGVVLMDERGVSCATVVHFAAACGTDNSSLCARCDEIAEKMEPWLYAWQYDVIVFEGFVTFAQSARQNAFVFQTPFLCGYLYHLFGQTGRPVYVQTSRQVFSPSAYGSWCYGARDKEQLKQMKLRAAARLGGAEKLKNDHERSAALHGQYWLMRHGKE